MKDSIDNLNKLRLQLIGVANQTGNTGASLLVEDFTKEIKTIQKEWSNIKGQDVIFKHLLKCKEFHSEIENYFTECLIEDRDSFDYHYEGIDFEFTKITGTVRIFNGDYETPPDVEVNVTDYRLEAFYYCEEGDFENIPVDGALLELVRLKLKFND